MDELKKVLYITYDGLTDPLGQSQILPYLIGLSKHGYAFTVLSFEKEARMTKEQANVNEFVRQAGIIWVPLPFTTRPPFLSKFYDAVQMRRKAVELQKRENFAMVHCRSYLSADVGLHLKKRFGVKFFFDMRGFWADEKKDGSWNVANPLYKRIYRYYKNREAQYLRHADYIISLTHAGKKEMGRWHSFNAAVPIQVIPCCADMDHFSLTSDLEKQQSRSELGIASGRLVVSYLGSIGTWYMLDEMLDFFAVVKEQYPDALFLFLTHSDQSMIRQSVQAKQLNENDFIIREATRKEVPYLVKASDVNLSFIKPVYSKISSSPTKLGEVLSMGIPVISNSGVGDVKEIINATESGYVLDAFNAGEYRKAVLAMPALLKKDPKKIRTAAEQVYSLLRGVELYQQCYAKVLR